MIEYLHDTIRASAGDTIAISAKITDSAGAIIQDTCTLCLYDGNNKLLDIEGVLEENIWTFTINADITTALAGRYWYKVCDCNHNSLDFAQPIYFITRGKGSDKFEAGKQFAEAAVKPELKAAIEERGATIPEDAALSTYADYLRSCPSFAAGTFTPEENTDKFEVKDLGFTPTFFAIYVIDDITDYSVGGVCRCTLVKNGDGLIRYMRTTGKYGNSQLPYAAAGSWFDFGEDSVAYYVPADTVGYLRAGYTYHYIVA
jgi:hypothetical protein